MSCRTHPDLSGNLSGGFFEPGLIEQMKATIDAPQAKQIYARHLAIIEPVFANIRVQKRLDHFTLRSKAKVDVQWKLFALVHNIGKIHHYGLAL
jgi:hypothetical protein